MPFHQIRPSRSESGLPMDAGHIWVPIDDDTCMVYDWCYSKSEALDEVNRLEKASATGRSMSIRRISARRPASITTT